MRRRGSRLRRGRRRRKLVTQADQLERATWRSPLRERPRRQRPSRAAAARRSANEGRRLLQVLSSAAPRRRLQQLLPAGSPTATERRGQRLRRRCQRRGRNARWALQMRRHWRRRCRPRPQRRARARDYARAVALQPRLLLPLARALAVPSLRARRGRLTGDDGNDLGTLESTRVASGPCSARLAGRPDREFQTGSGAG
jgi:hypothetical protein